MYFFKHFKNSNTNKQNTKKTWSEHKKHNKIYAEAHNSK